MDQVTTTENSGGVLDGLQELPDDRSWAEPVDPVAPRWKWFAGGLVALLIGFGGVALGAALKESPSSTGGATGQAGGRGQRLPGGLGAGGQGASGLGAGGLGGFSRIDQSATPTTLAPIEGRLTEVDPDYVSVRVGEEDSILAVTDDTLIIRTRTVTDKELAVGQQVRVEPTDADRIAAKSITILP